MSKEQVKSIEEKEMNEDTEGVLSYIGNIGNMDCAVGYIFIAEKLVRGTYLFTEKHIDLLISGLKKEEARETCSTMLFSLSNNKPDLFTEKHVRALQKGEKKQKIYEVHYSSTLNVLKRTRSDLFE